MGGLAYLFFCLREKNGGYIEDPTLKGKTMNNITVTLGNAVLAYTNKCLDVALWAQDKFLPKK